MRLHESSPAATSHAEVGERELVRRVAVAAVAAPLAVRAVDRLAAGGQPEVVVDLSEGQRSSEKVSEGV